MLGPTKCSLVSYYVFTFLAIVTLKYWKHAVEHVQNYCQRKVSFFKAKSSSAQLRRCDTLLPFVAAPKAKPRSKLLEQIFGRFLQVFGRCLFVFGRFLADFW